MVTEKKTKQPAAKSAEKKQWLTPKHEKIEVLAKHSLLPDLKLDPLSSV